MNGIKSYPLPILFFDQECPLCLRFKQSLDRIDTSNRIAKVPIQDQKIFEFFPHLNKQECYETVHLIDKEGKIHKGPEVPKFLLKQFPSVSKFAWLAETQVGQKAVEFFYNTASRYRESLLNRCPKCKKSHKEKTL